MLETYITENDMRLWIIALASSMAFAADGLMIPDSPIGAEESAPMDADIASPPALDETATDAANESVQHLDRIEQSSDAQVPQNIRRQLEGMSETQKTQVEENLKKYRERRQRMFDNMPAERREALEERRVEKAKMLQEKWDNMPQAKKAAHRQRMVDSFSELPRDEQQRLLKRFHKIQEQDSLE